MPDHISMRHALLAFTFAAFWLPFLQAQTSVPALRIGEIVHVELRAKLQGDFRRFEPVLAGAESNQLTRARLGLKGRVLNHFDYEVEREFRGTFGATRLRSPWTDVYVEVRDYFPLRIKAGKFKLPFGMEENTSSANLDFVYRTRASDFLTPGRDKGMLARGQILRKWRLSYEGGIFKNDGENAHEKDDPTKTGGATFAAHVNGQPLRGTRLPVRRLELGAAVTSSSVPEGRSPAKNSLRGHTAADQAFFHRMFVQGRRLRLGVEMNWTGGPFSVKSELIRVSEQRKATGVEMQDLPDFISKGWYLTGTWLITGEEKSEDLNPKRVFLTGRGLGALELAIRYEGLQFGSASHPGIASRSARAPNIMENSDRALTLGATWYLNRFAKIQVNNIREVLADPQTAPIPGRLRYSTTVLRLQFHL